MEHAINKSIVRLALVYCIATQVPVLDQLSISREVCAPAA